MIPKIKSVIPIEKYKLRVAFVDGKEVIYDVMEDIQMLPGYSDLATVFGLFEKVQLDQSRTIVFWNDEIDLPSDVIYEHGSVVQTL